MYLFEDQGLVIENKVLLFALILSILYACLSHNPKVNFEFRKRRCDIIIIIIQITVIDNSTVLFYLLDALLQTYISPKDDFLLSLLTGP